jgi:adenylyl-sulfate kinase
MVESKNIVWSQSNISPEQREQMLGNKGAVVWLTGLSGSGKSTIAKALEENLFFNGTNAYILDGDNVRHSLNADLGFSDEDREENIRRVGAVAALFADAGIVTIVSFISPFEKGRKQARNLVGDDRFFEVFLDVPLNICEERDPKGLYKKVRAGQISKFTGIDSPYEQPSNPELIINTAEQDVDTAVSEIITMLKNAGIINK